MQAIWIGWGLHHYLFVISVSVSKDAMQASNVDGLSVAWPPLFSLLTSLPTDVAEAAFHRKNPCSKLPWDIFQSQVHIPILSFLVDAFWVAVFIFFHLLASTSYMIIKMNSPISTQKNFPYFPPLRLFRLTSSGRANATKESRRLFSSLIPFPLLQLLLRSTFSLCLSPPPSLFEVSFDGVGPSLTRRLNVDENGEPFLVQGSSWQSLFLKE